MHSEKLHEPRRLQKLVWAGTTVALALSCIRPPFPDDQALQHVPTVVALIGLAVAIRKRWLSNRAYLLFSAFLALHILGARYVYTTLPYDAWSRSLFDWSPQEAFGFERNHYDRFVHFSFGVLSILFFDEILRRRLPTRLQRVLFGILFVGAISALYEVVEWGLSLTAPPAMAHRYNGQQGDFWDAQKDMALAFLGSVLALPAVFLRSRG